MTSAIPPPTLEQGIQASRDRLGMGGERWSLGVLLVHGIGEQTRGDTLTEEGDHIVRWLRRRASGGEVDVLDVVARQASGDEIPAAHAALRITPPSGEPSQWLVAESFWADVFRPATYGELAGWAVTVGPWVYATQVAAITRRIEIGENVPTWLRLFLVPITLLTGLVMLIGAALVGLFVTVLAVGLLLLALTRIPLVADLARSLQRGLANGFGDAYVLTRSPVRFGAMATQVRTDLQVLTRQCEAVAVVAHSQGTAVSWFALQREIRERPDVPPPGTPEPAPIGLFVTYGQAVRKLTFALKMARGAQTGFQGVLALASAVLVGLSVVALLAGWHPAVVAALVVLAGVAESILVASARQIWKEAGEEIESDWSKVTTREPGLEWLDLWASADPAPVGPLDVKGKGVRSFKIRNLSSIVVDHFKYWANTTEFLPIVCSRLLALGGPPAYAADLADPRLQATAMRRHARVLLLLAMRIVVIGGIIAWLLYAWMTPNFGSALLDLVAKLDLPFVDDFFNTPPDWAIALAAYLAVILVGALAYLPITGGWNALIGQDEVTYFRGIRRPLWSLAWFGLAALAAVIALAVGWLLVKADAEAMATAYAFATGLVILLSVTVLASGGKGFAETEKSQNAMVAARKITRNLASSLVITLFIAALLVGVPLALALVGHDAAGPVLIGESVLLSAILAVEGIRQYRLFTAAFDDLNDQLLPPNRPAP